MGDIGQVMGEVKSWLTSSLYLELLQTIVKGTRLVGGGVQCYRSARTLGLRVLSLGGISLESRAKE